MNLISRIFSSNNENYNIAKNSLSRVKNRLSDFIDNFPDVTIPEILYMNQKWFTLPENLGTGVSVLGLDVNENYSSLLVYYDSKGFLTPHSHDKDFELNKIIKGSITNKITGECFETGDTFIIDKKERHYLKANEETFVYCLITPNEEFLDVPHIKPQILERFNQFKPGYSKI